MPIYVNTNQTNRQGFSNDSTAQSLSDLFTNKQFGMIRALSRELQIDADEECYDVMGCHPAELSIRAASAFIGYLQDMQGDPK